MIVTCENCTSRFVVDPKVLLPRGRRVRCARCKTVWFQAPQTADGVSGDADITPTTTPERKQVFQRAPQVPETSQQNVFAKPEEGQGGPAASPDPEPAAPLPEPDVDDESIGQAASDSIDEDIDALYGDDPSGAEDDDGLEDLPWGEKNKPLKSQVPALYKKRSPVYQIAGWAALVALILAAAGSVIYARDSIAQKLPSTKKIYAAVGLDITPRIITENVAAYLNIETPPPQPAYWRDDQLIQEIKGTIINTADAPVRVPTLEGILRDRDNNELYRWLFSAETDILNPGQRASFATEIVDLPQEAAEMELVFAEGRDAAPMLGAAVPGSQVADTSR